MFQFPMERSSDTLHLLAEGKSDVSSTEPAEVEGMNMKPSGTPNKGPSWAIYTAGPEMKLSQKVRNHHNSILALSPGPTHPGFQRFIPKRAGTPSSQPFFIAFSPSRSQMSKPTQNPRPIFFGNKGNIFWKQGSKKSCTFLDTSTATKPRDIHIQVRRTLLYRVPSNTPMFHNKIQPPMERFFFFLAQIPRFGLQLF